MALANFLHDTSNDLARSCNTHTRRFLQISYIGPEIILQNPAWRLPDSCKVSYMISAIILQDPTRIMHDSC